MSTFLEYFEKSEKRNIIIFIYNVILGNKSTSDILVMGVYFFDFNILFLLRTMFSVLAIILSRLILLSSPFSILVKSIIPSTSLANKAVSFSLMTLLLSPPASFSLVVFEGKFSWTCLLIFFFFFKFQDPSAEPKSSFLLFFFLLQLSCTFSMTFFNYYFLFNHVIVLFHIALDFKK